MSYELYKHFRDNTKGFAELAAFQPGQIPLGVKRVRSTEVARSYPGEFVSGNYFRCSEWRRTQGVRLPEATTDAMPHPSLS